MNSGWLLRVAAIAILCPGGRVQGQPAADAASLYRDGQQAQTAREYRRAAGLFAAAADAEGLKPADARSDARLLQARCLSDVGDLPASRSAVELYLQQQPHSAAALYLLAHLLERDNQARRSLETFTRAAAVKPPTAEDLRVVGLDYVLIDDYIDAVHWLKASVAAEPGREEGWYDLGRALMHEGDFVQAERDFRKALEIDPRLARAFDNLGLSLEGQNRTDEALEAYRGAIAAQEKAPHASEQPLLNLGTLLITKNRAAEAVEPLRKAVELAPSSSRCHEELARAYRETHQEELARAEMERAVALEPANPRFHYQLGQMYRRAGLTDQADAELKLSSDLYGTHSSANPH